MTNLIAISGKKQSGKNLVAKIMRYLMVGADKALISFDKWDGESVWGDISNKFHRSVWEEKGFADKVKDMLCILTGCTKEDLENEKFKNSYLPEEWNRWVLDFYARPAYKEISEDKGKLERYANGPGKGMHGNYEIKKEKITYRQALQWIGTDLFRDKFHPNTWVNALFADYHDKFSKLDILNTQTEKITNIHTTQQSNWIITDTRFLNEVQAVKDRKGIVIRVNRTVCPNCGESENLHWPHVETNPDYLCNECGKFWQLDSHDSETGLDNYKDFDFILDNSDSVEELIEKVRQILIKENLI